MGGQGMERGRPGRRGRRRRKLKTMSEINVTPFVDVMLVLLVVFMIAAPLLTSGVQVELPETSAETLPVGSEQPLTVTLTADGRILLMNTEVTREELIPKLDAIARERESSMVFLRADGSIPYERVAQVMAALDLGGFHEIGLVTEPGAAEPGEDGQG